MAKSRRTFLKNAVYTSLGFLGLQSYLSTAVEGCVTNNGIIDDRLVEGFGQLYRDNSGLFNLPSGFSYKIIQELGDKMTDGLLSSAKPDGMATFKGSNGRVIIIRNHEIMPFDTGPFGKKNRLIDRIDQSKIYDPGSDNSPSLGGTTTLVFNEQTQKVEKSFQSLIGTVRNCAGGKTPWGSWVTCEEIVVSPEDIYTKFHGYNFEVPATEEIKLHDPIPLIEMGRFNHEAICVDPKTGIVYQTEDRGDGLIYRFIPNTSGQLANGGRLQALAFIKKKTFDTRSWIESEDQENLEVGDKVDVEWIDVKDFDPPDDIVRQKYAQRGAAVFARGEGMWFGDGHLYFACTNGGKSQLGQVFKYTPSEYEGTNRETESPGVLELFIEPNDVALLKSGDNLTVSPWGDIIICEDTPRPFLVGVTPKGKIYKIGQNIGFPSEIAGCTFSPSGKTLFLNIQHMGATIAITGPWDKIVH